MLELIYDSISKYFKALSTFGYFNYSEVNKLLLIICIEDIIYNDFYGYLEEEDYKIIEKVLSSIFCTTCIIPYPKYTKQMNNLFLGSITELAYRQNKTEKELSDYKDKTDKSIAVINTAIDNANNNITDLENSVDVINNNIVGINSKIDAIQNTKVIKSKQDFDIIDDIIPNN